MCFFVHFVRWDIDETYCAACKAEYQIFNVPNSQLPYFIII